ncbi:MAG: hypothetical protein ONB46_21980 [candidate division KSB1 bacterium]|nr:hypothetical protein [candidate division KSB1 bacterium]MDZ7368544.1 hypothetical protein [candidate division KSB1 bacterium]MDZ7406228.1 hypothetical protein [candidate division KSB1 bacterium]
MSTVVLVACSSHTPQGVAIPAVRETTKNVQAESTPPQQAPADSQYVDDFTSKVLPIVSKCQPCHFKGGKVYAQLPFDNPKTIRHLGTKLFTRIRDENQQAIIRAFLTQSESVF